MDEQAVKADVYCLLFDQLITFKKLCWYEVSAPDNKFLKKSHWV